MKTFHVYILASRSRALYVGVTSDLLRRIHEHRQHLVPGTRSAIGSRAWSTAKRPGPTLLRPSRARSRSRAGVATRRSR
ncbi:MAG TPA: GIY-YIG nuclease family protein [Luteimonas sp.]|nr:GIY-YIG nuclease family protein [Luteimonas sp.]